MFFLCIMFGFSLSLDAMQSLTEYTAYDNQVRNNGMTINVMAHKPELVAACVTTYLPEKVVSKITSYVEKLQAKQKIVNLLSGEVPWALADELYEAIDKACSDECKNFMASGASMQVKDFAGHSLLYRAATAESAPLQRKQEYEALYKAGARVASYKECDLLFEYILKEGNKEMIQFFLERKWTLPKGWRAMIEPHSFGFAYEIVLGLIYESQLCMVCHEDSDSLSCGLRFYPDVPGQICDNCAQERDRLELEKILGPIELEY
jgi:hypothetical protein